MFCVTFGFHFSWALQPSQEKLNTMLMRNFLGENKVHYGRCASGVYRQDDLLRMMTRAYKSNLCTGEWRILAAGDLGKDKSFTFVLTFVHTHRTSISSPEPVVSLSNLIEQCRARAVD